MEATGTTTIPVYERNTAATIAAMTYMLWGVLHIYVGIDGLINYFGGGYMALMTAVLGGWHAPIDKFQFHTDQLTLEIMQNFMLNFNLDVGAFGILGVFLGLMLWKMSKPWLVYFMWILVIGLADLAFLFLQVVPGNYVGNWASYGGPILWFMALVVAPFGMPKLRWNEVI